MKDSIAVGDIVEFFVTVDRALTKRTGLVIETFNAGVTAPEAVSGDYEKVVRIEMHDGNFEQRFGWQVKKVL